MKEKGKLTENYLEKIPYPKAELKWEVDPDCSVVTLLIENKGFYNRLAQKIFKRPRVSYIKLDDIGSFAFEAMTGEKSIFDIGKMVEEEFGEKAQPLYARLAMFFKALDANKLIDWK